MFIELTNYMYPLSLVYKGLSVMWRFANNVLHYVAMILQSLTARCATVMVLELALIEVDARLQGTVNGGV